jgi:hypothetical protein
VFEGGRPELLVAHLQPLLEICRLLRGVHD